MNDQDNKKSSKLIVRNVAFQATQTELRALFSTFGTVKRVRIPRKMDVDGIHRGFAFVEMASNQEATSSMLSLKNAHLYGRHLVIEWAKIEDEENTNEIQNIRKRAKKDEHYVSHSKKNRNEKNDDFEDTPAMDDVI